LSNNNGGKFLKTVHARIQSNKKRSYQIPWKYLYNMYTHTYIYM